MNVIFHSHGHMVMYINCIKTITHFIKLPLTLLFWHKQRVKKLLGLNRGVWYMSRVQLFKACSNFNGKDAPCKGGFINSSKNMQKKYLKIIIISFNKY